MGATAGGDGQRNVADFLADPANHRPRPDSVTRIDTHGAMVFLAGSYAYKVKRAVAYSYMDFSTPEKRRAACEREVEVNREAAPGIYLGVVAITREKDGKLALGGAGEPVEWAVRMRRFDEHQALDRLAAAGALDEPLLEELARVVAAAHARAPVRRGFDQAAAFARIIEQDAADLRAAPALFDAGAVADLLARTGAALARAGPLLAARGRDGFVRRCHGDLHLRNIVRIDGRPVLFDAIEFDEDIATVDVLYDLAFLLMDLDLRGLRAGANLVLNIYLKTAREDGHLDALGAFPLFLSSRAAIRARVTASLLAHAGNGADPAAAEAARTYFAAARACLAPPPPRLVAVGGLSGTGKTTLARRLAPHVGAAPGAVHLRSDVERKVLFGVAETERLGARGYAPETTARVYARLTELAGRVLRAGHAAVVDAVFAAPAERAAVEEVARRAGVPFAGLWLDAPADVLVARVEGRRNDASDATAEVVRRQLGYDLGDVAWPRLVADGTPDLLARRALDAVGKD